MIRKTGPLSPLVRERLLSGDWWNELLDGKQIPDDDLAALWDEHKEELVRQHIAEHPGSRPWGWWHFDAPEPRKRIVPGGPYTRYFSRASCGVPENCDPAEYETELAYLKRLGLLTPAEREL